MREKPLATGIMLLGGGISAITCLFKGASLLQTLFVVFISLVIFLIIGLIANSVYTTINREVKEAVQAALDKADRERREAQLAAEEAREAEARKREQIAEQEARERIAKLYADRHPTHSIDDLFDDDPDDNKQTDKGESGNAGFDDSLVTDEAAAESSKADDNTEKYEDDGDIWSDLRG